MNSIYTLCLLVRKHHPRESSIRWKSKSLTKAYTKQNIMTVPYVCNEEFRRPNRAYELMKKNCVWFSIATHLRVRERERKKRGKDVRKKRALPNNELHCEKCLNFFIISLFFSSTFYIPCLNASEESISIECVPICIDHIAQWNMTKETEWRVRVLFPLLRDICSVPKYVCLNLFGTVIVGNGLLGKQENKYWYVVVVVVVSFSCWFLSLRLTRCMCFQDNNFVESIQFATRTYFTKPFKQSHFTFGMSICECVS